MQELKIETEIILQFFVPRRLNSYPVEWYSSFLDEFPSFSSQILLYLLPSIREQNSIEIFDSLKSSRFAYTKKYIKDEKNKTYAVFNFDLILDKQKTIELLELDNSQDISAEKIIKIIERGLIDQITILTKKICLIVNIAKPGVFNLSNSYIFINKQFQEKLPPLSSEYFDMAYSTSVEYNWPKISGISTLQAWNWANKIPGFEDGVSSDRTGRALAALSYILLQDPTYHTDGYAEIIWPLLGLESLYANSNVGTKSQLLEKSEAFLGTRISNKKKFGTMYDFRSRFLHGDIDFNYSFESPDANSESEKFIYKSIEAHTIATSMLIATFQKMICLDIHNLEFKYIINST